MIAEIVSVGTELLMGQIVDTNAKHLGQFLPELGISHHFRQTVGDNHARLESALMLALSRSDIVFTIGGLGPTEDDMTRDAIATVMGVELELVPEYAEKLKRLFVQRNLPWGENQTRQAMRPVGATQVENPNGSAPGLICPFGEKVIIALPGPRGEFIPMVNGPIREYLATRSTGQIIHSRILRICAMGESQVEGQLQDLMHGVNPSLAPYAKLGEVHLRLTAMAGSVQEADGLLDPVETDIRSRLTWRVYGLDQTTLEAACLQMMIGRKLSIGTAESITGGGVAARLTGVPGSGKAFCGSFITYDPATKTRMLGVPEELFHEFGPVSSECAISMAEGGKERLQTDVCLSLTGNAGPEADVDDKPVGLVYVALATPDGTKVEEHRFRGLREDIRERASQVALTMLYRWLVGA